MKPTASLLAISAVLLGASIAAAQTAGTLSADQEARRLLAAAALSYERIAVLTGEVRVKTRRGDAVSEETFRVGREGGTTAFVDGPRFQALAEGSRLLVAKKTVGRKVVERQIKPRPAFLLQLSELLSWDDLPPLLPLALQKETPYSDLLEILRQGELGPLTAVAVDRAESERGRSVVEIRFAADNGRVLLRLRPDDFLLISIETEIETDSTGEARYRMIAFDPRMHDSLDPPAGLDARHRVEAVEDLVVTRLEPGELLPALILPTLGGREISLTNLRGAATVMVFWSVDCQICRRDLARLDELARWLDAADIKARLLAVNTLDTFDSPQSAQDDLVAAVEAAGLSQPVILDPHHELFLTLGSSQLPEVLAVGPDLRILGFVDGLSDENLTTLKTLLRATAAEAAAADSGGEEG